MSLSSLRLSFHSRRFFQHLPIRSTFTSCTHQPQRYATTTTTATERATVTSNRPTKTSSSSSSSSSHNKSSPESPKRIKLKKPRITLDEPNLFDGDGVCAAYCVHNPVSLSRVARFLGKGTSFIARKRGVHVRYTSSSLQMMSGDVVHAVLQPETNEFLEEEDKEEYEYVEKGHAFLFRSGALVLWGLPLDLRRQLFDAMSTFQEDISSSGTMDTTTTTATTTGFLNKTNTGNDYNNSNRHKSNNNNNKVIMGMRDFEHEFRYSIITNSSSTKNATCTTSSTTTTTTTTSSSSMSNQEPYESYFKNDEIVIATDENSSKPEIITTHFLALSYGLAQSVRLLVYEEVVDSLVARTRTLPDELARHGHVKLSHRELKRLIGELLAARYSVNLVSDILDTPEYFWQHADLERLHLECSREVELRQRARILDTRTEVIKDALAILNNELSSSSSDRVERAILFLIGVEVAIEVAKAAQHAMKLT